MRDALELGCNRLAQGRTESAYALLECTCQLTACLGCAVARPMSDCTLEVGVESHDKLYRNPFLDPLAAHELKADIATPLDEKK